MRCLAEDTVFFICVLILGCTTMASTFNAQMLQVEHFLAQLVYSHLLLHVRTNKMGITFPQMDSPHMKSKVCICCTVNSY